MAIYFVHYFSQAKYNGGSPVHKKACLISNKSLLKDVLINRLHVLFRNPHLVLNLKNVKILGKIYTLCYKFVACSM